jgi:hypothetical protein
MPSLFGKAPKLPEKSFDFSEEFDKLISKASSAGVSQRTIAGSRTPFRRRPTRCRYESPALRTRRLSS